MNLPSFLDLLTAKRDIVTIESVIDPALEIGVLTDFVSKNNGPALRFKQIKDCDIEVVTNMFGSAARMALSLGSRDLAHFFLRVTDLLRHSGCDSSATGFSRLHHDADRNELPFGLVAHADLGLLPGFRFWPHEVRPFFTLAVVITKHPATNQQNYGLYRVGFAGDRSLTLNLLPHSGGAAHLRLWQQVGKKMPVAILLGADPPLIFSAAVSLPETCDEFEFSAWLQQQPMNYMHCSSVPLVCPAPVQVLLEGWIDIGKSLNEGPFGCYRGEYGGGNDCPLVNLSGIYAVDQPIIPQTLAGPLPMEDSWLMQANLYLLRARLSVDLPWIQMVEMPLDAAFYGVYFVQLDGVKLPAAAVAEELRRLDYFAHLQMLVVLPRGAFFVESGWRESLATLPAENIWQEDTALLKGLIANRPPELQIDLGLRASLLARLKTDGFNLKKICEGAG